MQMTEENIDTSKALDASSVDKEGSMTESKEQDTSSRSRNDAHDDVADIRPIYDEEPMAEVQMTAEIDVFAIGQQHTEQPEFNNEGERLSQNDLQGSRTESGFKRTFATLSCQDTETFTGTMFLNVEQLEKQLDKEYIQEIKSMAAFNYTQQSILEFREILIQHLEYVKKSIDERVQLKREYDSWVNERQMQMTEENIDTSKALDASSVDKEGSTTESKEQDTSSRSRNDAHDDVADIRPIYDEEPMAEVQTTAEIDVFAIGQQHTEQPEFNNKGEVVQNAEECHDTCPLPAILTDNQIAEPSYQSLESKIFCLKKTVAQFQKVFSRLEAHYSALFIAIGLGVFAGKEWRFMGEVVGSRVKMGESGAVSGGGKNG
nr:hypothetical protein [Tanacetum cinerariifolium]